MAFRKGLIQCTNKRDSVGYSYTGRQAGSQCAPVWGLFHTMYNQHSVCKELFVSRHHSDSQPVYGWLLISLAEYSSVYSHFLNTRLAACCSAVFNPEPCVPPSRISALIGTFHRFPIEQWVNVQRLLGDVHTRRIRFRRLIATP